MRAPSAASSSPFPTWNGIDGQQPWTTIQFTLPTAPLRPGANTLTVVDRVSQGGFGLPPYLLLADATLTIALRGAG